MNLMEKYLNMIPEPPGQCKDGIQTAIEKVADDIVVQIIQLGRWRESSETRRLEAEAVKVQHDCVSGRGQLIDFQQACKRWKMEGTK